MVLDGSEACDRRIRSMISWDVLHGVARRAWAGHAGARAATERALAAHPELRVTPAEPADPGLVRDALGRKE
jgi:urocanate hydratase